MNFQIYKLDFEESEEPEIRLQTFIGSWRQQGNPRKTSTSASLTMLKPLIVWITTNCRKFLKRWEYKITYRLRNLYMGQEATIRIEHGTMDWFKIRKGVQQGCILSPLLFNLCRVHHAKYQAGRITSWNQDCQEKHQQSQKCR